jgi:hypothetical protein
MLENAGRASKRSSGLSVLKATIKKKAYPAEKSIFILAGDDRAEQKDGKNRAAFATATGPSEPEEAPSGFHPAAPAT